MSIIKGTIVDEYGNPLRIENTPVEPATTGERLVRADGFETHYMPTYKPISVEKHMDYLKQGINLIDSKAEEENKNDNVLSLKMGGNTYHISKAEFEAMNRWISFPLRHSGRFILRYEDFTEHASKPDPGYEFGETEDEKLAKAIAEKLL